MTLATSNVEIVERVFASGAAHDRRALFACLEPDVQWHMQGPHGERPVQRGREKLWQFNEDVYRRFDEVATVVSDAVEVGSQVVARIHTRGHRRDGAEGVDWSYTAVFQLRSGRIWSVENFDDHDEAVMEARLRT